MLSNDLYNLRACSVMLRVLRAALAMSGMLSYIVRSVDGNRVQICNCSDLSDHAQGSMLSGHVEALVNITCP
jgi:hypothetical protein